jgi:hypothetical protein
VVCGVVFELSDQKVRDFLVLITFNQRFFKHAHKVFGAMPVRI